MTKMNKAWTGGLAAWLGGYVIQGLESILPFDLPADAEMFVVGLIAAALVWLIPNK